MLQDIAVLTGAQVISEKLGPDLNSADVEHLGRDRQIHVTKENTTIVDGEGSKDDIDSRIKQLRYELEAATSEVEMRGG